MNEFLNLIISTMFPILLQASSGEILAQYGLYLNLSILALFALNILIVATDTSRNLLDSCIQYLLKKRQERKTRQRLLRRGTAEKEIENEIKEMLENRQQQSLEKRQKRVQ